MARRYALRGEDTNTQSTTIIGLTSTTAVRPKLYDMVFGSDATPADNAAEYNIIRYTNPGVGTNLTPQALDPGDPSATASGATAQTTEPTYTANASMLDWAQNQRATFRWVAAPNGEIVLPATSNAGIGLYVFTVAGNAVNCNATWHYEE